MIRSDVLKTLIPMISDQLVVSNIGLPSQELHLLDDQPTNFYMLGTMGLSHQSALALPSRKKPR
jgi:sulfopyruvate decarboxylase subunit beta